MRDFHSFSLFLSLTRNDTSRSSSGHAVSALDVQSEGHTRISLRVAFARLVVIARAASRDRRFYDERFVIRCGSVQRFRGVILIDDR